MNDEDSLVEDWIDLIDGLETTERVLEASPADVELSDLGIAFDAETGRSEDTRRILTSVEQWVESRRD